MSTSKTYIAQRQLPNGLRRRVTVASAAELPLEKAREAAAELLLSMRQGRDPKVSRRATSTLRQTLDAYLAEQKNLRPRSVEAYRDTVTRHLAPWLDLPLKSINSEMVAQRHGKIAAEVKERGRGKGHATANGAMRALKALWNFSAERNPDLPADPVKRKRLMFKVPCRTRMVRPTTCPRSTRRSAGCRTRWRGTTSY